MKRKLSRTGLQLLAMLLFFVTVFATSSGRSEEQKQSECCFEREGYQGTCRVTPAEDETCKSILAYLNTPGTVGKNYCGGSKLRGDWKEVQCEAPSDQKAD